MWNRIRLRPFKLERRLVVDSTLFGVLLTLFVAASDTFGWLAPLERWLYDQRAARCQLWMPKPTDRLVHLDIDKAAEEVLGRWPWRRGVLAEMLDEVAAAKPRAVALDVLLQRPQEEQNVVDKKSHRLEHVIDHDALLAASVGRVGNAVLSARLPFRGEPAPPAYAAMLDLLASDPSLEPAVVATRLRDRGFSAEQITEAVGSEFNRARHDAIFKRIGEESESLPVDDLRKQVLPGVTADTKLFASPALLVFEEESARVEAVRAFARFALPPRPRSGELFQSQLVDAPIVRLSRAASAGGFVDYPPSKDGKVRSVPLFVESGGRAYPQLGVALAMKFLGADPAAVRIAADHVVIPRPGMGDLRVPVRTVASREFYAADGDVPAVADVSWFGGPEWERMYDPDPSRVERRQHVSLAYVWDVCALRRSIRVNNGHADEAMRDLLPFDLSDEYEKLRPDLDDPAARMRFVEAAIKEGESAPPRADGKVDEPLRRKLEVLRTVRDETPKLVAQLAARRRELADALGGRAVLVGWTSTASIADFLPTSLHPRCPGVVLHGVVFNQILTGEVWRTLPKWMTVLTTLAVGLLATLVVSFLSPGKGAAAVGALALGYLALNGFLLFDKLNLILGAAGPMVTIAAVWSGGTLAKLGMERWERARITRRFRSYADPKLVDYVLAHPNENLFEGQVRELTVVFVDLVRFTDLTEKLGASTVQLLNELWETLIPVIKANDAYVNKFLGDGLMFLFGAPEQSPFHARDAVRTVFAVHKALAGFNERAVAKGWPALSLRFGISTGNMVVGDTGAPGGGRTDYSVIGDYANLGARLESANKAVGTTVLMTDRTVELAGEGFLFRPIGKLCVVGKQAGVMTYEVLAELDEATTEQKSLAADTKDVVESFLAGRLQDCVAALHRMESNHGPGKLTALYRDRCRHYLEDPSAGPFDCQIVLTEK